MALQTAEEYYSSKSNYGKYAYISLVEIIDELLGETIDPDNYLTNIRRSRLVAKAKEGIRVLNREVKKTIYAAEITVGPKLYLPLPQDYIDWVRVSVVDENYKLHPLRTNYDIPTAPGYLQDNNYDILFDNNGAIMTADSSNQFNKPYSRYVVLESDKGYYNGEFIIDEKRGVIGFSSDLEDKEIVIEYVSDGIQDSDLRGEEIYIHKNIKQVLMLFIYHECIKGKRNVPFNEKRRSKEEYKAYLHKAKLDNLHFNIAELNTKVAVQADLANNNG